MMQAIEMLTANEAAKHLGISSGRVRLLCRTGRIVGARVVGEAPRHMWIIPEPISITGKARGPESKWRNDQWPMTRPKNNAPS